jgi:hypothetical protein
MKRLLTAYRNKQYKVSFLVIAALVAVILLFTTCMTNQVEVADPVIPMKDGNRLVGSAACKTCHADIYNSYLATAHQRTSKPPLKQFIKGNFDEGKNLYVYSYDDAVRMLELDSGFFQANFHNRNFDTAYKFGMVIGSGTRGQSYLYWAGTRLFQLPVSYFTSADSWANSPGYPDDIPLYSRSIHASCLGCHMSYATKLPSSEKDVDQFDPGSMVYGVNCERCHGAGGQHVDFHQANPTVKDPRYIINAAHLSRRQQLDACGVCHSSITRDLPTGFDFRTGDTFPQVHAVKVDSVNHAIEVHGNQYGLLASSKCFQRSGSITCTTCHDPHQQQRGKSELFSAKCQTCHSEAKHNFCGLAQTVAKENLVSRCVDCHMPAKSSNILIVKLNGEARLNPAVIRSHFISIYPEATKKVMDGLKMGAPGQ